MSITADFFRNRLDQMIDLRHPLAVLANRMPWQEIEASLAHLFARQVRTGKKIEELDLFGATEVIAGAGISNAGRPRLPTRLMVALLYLKHAFNESDEDLIQRWGETPTWQYFSGNEYFEHRWPCDPTQLVKFRKLLGEEGVEELLARTIEVAVTLKLIASKELSRIIVDSTVQEKAIAHPTDSKLLETARVKLVEAAKAEGIELKQTYAKEGQLLGYKAGRYAHARQFKRMRKAIKRQATIVGRLHREIARKMTTLSQAVQDALGVSIDKAKRLIAQSRSKKAQDKQPKLYSWHAPEVECISKVRREVANIIVSPAHKVGDETGRSVDRSLPVHALLATASCEATGTKCRALRPRRIPRGNGVTCEHQCGWDARLSGMVNKSELLKASLCTTSQRC
jgi:transposase, IS5 family